MENILELDLNQFASEQIRGKIETLENDLKITRQSLLDKRSEINKLEEQVKKSSLPLKVLEHLRNAFLKIEATPETEDSFRKSKEQNQFLFFECVLNNLFNVKSECGGWQGSGLSQNLAINFYNSKEIVVMLLETIKDNSAKEIAFIQSFRMPYDYTKGEVLKYVKEPNYNTNGVIYGISQYWLSSGAGKSNMPHDLIMKSPFILDENVFNEIINSINNRVSNYYYLFALPKYNKEITIDQIKLLGECIVNLRNDVLNYDVVRHFIESNLKHFNTKTLDFFFNSIRTDNQFATLHWEKFPNEYQMKFLMSKPINEVLSAITHYSCKWSMEQKEEFLRKYATKSKINEN